MEAEFRAWFAQHGRRWRLIVNSALLGYFLTMLALTTIMVTVPQPHHRWIQCAIGLVAVPLGAFSMLCCLWPRLHRYSVLASITSALVVAAMIMGMRVLVTRPDYDLIPLVMLAAILLSMVISLIPFSQLLPPTITGLLLGLGVELWAFEFDAPRLIETSSIAAIVLLSLVLIWEFEQLLRINWHRERTLNELAYTDALTGIRNRRHFDDGLRDLIRAAARDHCPLALMVIDVDHFKSYNDHYGHPAGDECLKRIALYLKSSIRRPQDLAGRLGGEEFAVVWFDAHPENATALSEALRRGIADLHLAPAPGKGSTVTVSAGLAQITAPPREASVEDIAIDLIRQADAALYAAKHQGRDRLVVSAASA